MNVERKEDFDNQDQITFRVKRGEPVFILRAQDRCAADTVRHWAVSAKALGAPKAKYEDAMRIADEMLAWPGETKVPD